MILINLFEYETLIQIKLGKKKKDCKTFVNLPFMVSFTVAAMNYNSDKFMQT